MDKGVRRGGFVQAGFTIVETMIVLAVTAVLFALIAGTLGQRQDEAEFRHAIQDVQTQIQQVINQVSVGFYPNDTTFSCTSSGNTIDVRSGSSPQGTNKGCVFLGKVIQFGIGSNPEQYQVYTVAAVNPPITNTPSSPQAFSSIDPTIATNSQVPIALTTGNLEYNLTTENPSHSNAMTYSQSGLTYPIGAIGFFIELGSLNSLNTNTYESGSQPVDLVAIKGTQLHPTQVIRDIDSGLQMSNNSGIVVSPSGGVSICFVSGSTNQSGLLSIGTSGRQLLVKLDILGDTTC
jgi:prepilin-type N-terminal cleavage/methylation domain-containing protein